MKPEKIIEIVCKDYGIDTVLLDVETRQRFICEPCQVAHFFAFLLTTLSEEKIGQLIGNKDRTTVIHSFKTVLNMLLTNRVWRSRIRSLGSKIMDEASKSTMSTYAERKELILNN